ncbi:MAG: 50S ribosomal protein L22 [Candidatus Marinimicrobia bacterium]|nr:50S ribosomal protein L22 [Candidatus Neomarinimicrobiota bacterium]|tara:strand:- start:20122 stop:20469 length:348 start_codon:yes stop_codon:yes gene_type:complete
MDSRAVTRYISQSSRKIRKTLALVKGKNVDHALNILHFSKEKAATVIEKTLRSALSNLMQGEEGQDVSADSVTIKEAFVNGGPVQKRFRARAQGRAARIRRPSSHLTIVITDGKN